MQKNDYELKTAPPYPPECQKSGCKEDTSIAFMRVFNKNTSKTEISGFGGHTGKSAYGYSSNGQIVMHDQFDFTDWVTRCGECYQLDLKGQGKRAIDNSRAYGEILAKQAVKEEDDRKKQDEAEISQC